MFLLLLAVSSVVSVVAERWFLKLFAAKVHNVPVDVGEVVR